MLIRVSDITFFDKIIFSNQQILFDLEQKLFKLQSFQRSTVSVPLKLKVSLFNLYCNMVDIHPSSNFRKKNWRGITFT